MMSAFGAIIIWDPLLDAVSPTTVTQCAESVLVSHVCQRSVTGGRRLPFLQFSATNLPPSSSSHEEEEGQVATAMTKSASKEEERLMSVHSNRW